MSSFVYVCKSDIFAVGSMIDCIVAVFKSTEKSSDAELELIRPIDDTLFILYLIEDYENNCTSILPNSDSGCWNLNLKLAESLFILLIH